MIDYTNQVIRNDESTGDSYTFTGIQEGIYK